MLHSPRLRHITFPRQADARRAIDLSAQLDRDVFARQETSLPEQERSFVEWLFARAGLDASLYRAESLSRRMSACLRALRASTLGDARRAVENDPVLLSQAIGALLVGVSSFFRDAEVFAALRNEVLPALVAGRKGLYVWSAGCAAGEELCSVAMLLAEMGKLEHSYLLGTDCRQDAIDAASAGRYSAAAVETIPRDLSDQFLRREGHCYRLSGELSQAMRWRAADILSMREPGFWDLILFRNTAIYLRAAATRELWPRFEGSLRVGGGLVLGKAERPAGAKKLKTWGPCIYRKVSR